MTAEAEAAARGVPVTLWALYRVFLSVGLFSFGGGLAPWIHREVVEARGWMTRDQFLSGYAVAQILPGVNSTNLAIFIGQRLKGPLGAVTALIGTLTAPLGLVLTAAVSYDLLLSTPAVGIALVGMAAAALGMLLRMAIMSARAGSRSIPAGLVMVATFVTVGVLRWPILAVLAAIVPLSIAAAWPRRAPDA